MAQAGTATVKFVGDYSQMNAGLASALAPAKLKGIGMKGGLAIGGAFAGAMAAVKVADFLTDSVAVTKQFDKELSSLKAVAGATGKQMDALRRQAIKMGADTVFSATEAAKAQTELAKGGLDASQILGGALKSSLNLAAAGELELADAAETTVNAMQLFGLAGRDTSKIADMLATAANRTTADVLDFAMSLKQGGAVAKTAGYSLNDTVVILEALAEAGIKNSDAGTSMKASLIQLLNPTKKQADLAEQLGISWVKQNGELKNGIQISKSLRKATADMTKAERTKTFAILAGTDGFRTLSALYDAGAGKLRNYSRANQEQGTAAETARTKTDNLTGDIEELSGAYETLQITVGTLVTPALRKVTQITTDATRGINNFLEGLDEDVIGGKSWLEMADGVFEVGKAFAQLPVDPDGGVKRFLNVLSGSTEEVSRIQATIRARMDAGKSLQRVSVIAKNARGRATQATRAEQRAEADLRRARRRFGDGSSEVLGAEVRLQRAKRRTIRLTKEAKAAERLQGIERKVVASRTRDQVVQEKSRIVVLNRQVRALGRKWEAEKRNNGNSKRARDLEEKIISKLKERQGTQKRLNNVLGDAARQIGPKFAKSLQNISGKAASMESALGRIPRKGQLMESALREVLPPLRRVGDTSKSSMGKATDAIGGYSDATTRRRKIINANLRALPPVTTESLRAVADSYTQKLEFIQNDGKVQSKRRGGLIEAVRQVFRGGGVPVAVSPGEMFKMPDGKTGVVPGRPTSADNVLTSMPVGTKVFTFDGQRRLMEGASESEALRSQLPHFASGGIVKPEVIGGSPKGREVANTAIGRVHAAAKRKLERAKRAAAAAPRGGSWRGGSGQYPGVSGDTDFVPGLGNALSAMSKAVGQSIYVRSGWRSYAEQAALYQAYLNGTGNLAAPPGSSNHESGRAADITPGSEVFGSAAGRFGLGFTVPGESWHIELLRRGGIVGLLQSLYTGGQVKVVKNVGKFLLNKGFDFRATAGILGNAYREALPPWNPASVGTGGGGLWGFTTSPVSLADLQNYASKRGKPWTDEILQTVFMLTHGNPPGMQLRGPMNALDTIPDTAKYFMDKWERPGVPALDDRIKGGFEASKILRDAGIVRAGAEGDSGPSPQEKAKAQRKRRREAREKRVRDLLKKAFASKSAKGKKGAYWQILNAYAKWGEFGSIRGAAGSHGGVMPDGKRSEAVEFLQRVGRISSIANPNMGAGRLADLVKWLGRNVEIHGKDTENDRLVKKLEVVRKAGGGRAEKKRARKHNRMGKRLASMLPYQKPLNRNLSAIEILQEQIGLAEQEHGAEWSEFGSEMSDREIGTEVKMNTRLWRLMQNRKTMLESYLPSTVGQANSLEKQLKQYRKNPKLRWKAPGVKKALDATRAVIPDMRESLEALIGKSGQGGSLADVNFRLKELGVTVSGEQNAKLETDSAINSILQEQLATAVRNNALLAAQNPIYQRFMSTMPGQWAGAFAEGGVIPRSGWALVGERGPELISARAGQEVIPNHEVAGALSPAGPVPIQLTVIVEDEAVDVSKIRAVANGEAVRVVSNVRRGNVGAPKYRTAGLRG